MTDRDEIIRRSNELVDGGQLEENAELLASAVEHFPDDPELWVRGGIARHDTDPAEAGRMAERAVELAGDDERILGSAARVMFLTGRLAEARDLLKRALDSAPDDSPLIGGLVHLSGRLARAAGKDDLAEPLLREAFEVEPGGAGHAEDLAVLLAQGGRIQETLDVIERGLEHRPGDAALLHLRGELRAALADDASGD